MKKYSTLRSTFILSASALFVRMLGFGFRVYLSKNMGAQGMGLYSLIMSVYTLSITLATSGISMAVSKLSAAQLALGSKAGARLVLRWAIILSLVLSCLTGVALYLYASPIAVHILRDSRTAMSLRLLAPGLPFLSVCACMRGYFIACRRVLTPASAQVIEQLFKMGFIMALLGVWMPRGIEYACALTVLGITLGEAVCFLYTFVCYLIDRSRRPDTDKANGNGVVRSILGFALPVSLSSYFRSFMRLAEDVLIVSGLRAFGKGGDEATGIYGMLRGMVMPLLIFPLNLLSAFVVTLTPEVSRLHALSEKRRLGSIISRILQLTSLMGIFIVCVLTSFSYDIGVVVYGDAQVGEMLRSMAFLCPFMCVEMVVVSILQGMGEQTHSSVYSACDCVLRVVLVWVLTPRFGVWGFVAMVAASNLFTSLLNLRRLLKITQISLKVGDWILKPLLAGLTASQVVKLSYNFMPPESLAMWQSLCLRLMIIGVAYAAMLFVLGCVTREDIAWALKRFHPGPRQMHAVSQKGLAQS